MCMCAYHPSTFGGGGCGSGTKGHLQAQSESKASKACRTPSKKTRGEERQEEGREDTGKSHYREL